MSSKEEELLSSIISPTSFVEDIVFSNVEVLLSLCISCHNYTDQRTRRQQMKLKFYEKKEFIETAKGNRIARSCEFKGARNIMLSGKAVLEDKVTIRLVSLWTRRVLLSPFHYP